MERCPSDCRASDYHVSDGREADQGGDGQGRGAAPAAPTLGKVVCGHPLPITDLLGYIIIFESLTLSNGVWTAPNGENMRVAEAALAEETQAAQVLGFKVENLKYPAMDLKYEDRTVVEVLRRIEGFKVNTIICPWERDI